MQLSVIEMQTHSWYVFSHEAVSDTEEATLMSGKIILKTKSKTILINLSFYKTLKNVKSSQTLWHFQHETAFTTHFALQN